MFVHKLEVKEDRLKYSNYDYVELNYNSCC